MTCLRARAVRLQVVRGTDDDQYPKLVVPINWTDKQVLEYARTVHAPLGHTVTIIDWSGTNVWLPDPSGFADYKTGELA